MYKARLEFCVTYFLLVTEDWENLDGETEINETYLSFNLFPLLKLSWIISIAHKLRTGLREWQIHT